jgi:hypothetical protein
MVSCVPGAMAASESTSFPSGVWSSSAIVESSSPSSETGDLNFAYSEPVETVSAKPVERF